MKTSPVTRVSVLLLIVLLWHSALLAEDIPLSKKGGVYQLPVEINGVLTLNFVLDSGASEVLIPADVVLTLIRTGTIKETDFLPGQTYVLADGSTVKSPRFVLRSLKVGQRRIANVATSIGNISSALLLGQSFLEKLGVWGIDGQKQVLTIGTKVEKEVSSQHPYIPQKIYVPKKVIDWKELDEIFIKGNKLSYAGYEVAKSLNSTVITIKKNGETLKSLESQGGPSDIGLFPLLGKEVKQLIILTTTGGAICCEFHTIYELSPKFRLIFAGQAANIIDFDGNGQYDLVQSVSMFRYFHDLCGVCSPAPYAIFSYDKKIGKYVLSNRKFVDLILEHMDEHIKKFEDIDKKTSTADFLNKKLLENNNYNDWFSQILNIVLNYIYAGKGKKDGIFLTTDTDLLTRMKLNWIS